MCAVESNFWNSNLKLWLATSLFDSSKCWEFQNHGIIHNIIIPTHIYRYCCTTCIYRIFYYSVSYNWGMSILTHNKRLEIRQSTIYCAKRWVAWTMGQTNRRPRVMFQVLFFYTFFRLRVLKALYIYFCNFVKKIRK